MRAGAYRKNLRCAARRVCCALTLLLFSSCVASAQGTLEAHLSVTSAASTTRVRVEGKRAEGATAWSFRNTYAGATNLSARLENLTLADESGADVAVRQLAPGEYEAARAATRFRYDLRLDPPNFFTDAAHISWLTTTRGLLMPGDLLPLPLTDAKLSFALPAGWQVSTLETRGTDGVYDVKDAEGAVFVVGQDLRERRERAGASEFTYVSAGEWAFADEDVTRIIAETLKDYEKLAGGAPSRRRALVTLLPFPNASAVPAEAWNAETRGGTVVFLTGRSPSKLAALAQVNGSLTHELFHLWIPNGLALDGDYDWFYEGFTNYVALREGMRREQLTFQDYLNALGRAFDGYKSARGAKEVSLIEASARRWSGNGSLVYHKGMLVAFLYDLTLMRETGGKKSLDEVYRELYRRAGGGAEKREDANRALTEILGALPGMSAFTEGNVLGAHEINLSTEIEPFGLRVEPGGVRTHVSVSPALARGQRDLLRKLGYNEQADGAAASRKLHETLKKRKL